MSHTDLRPVDRLEVCVVIDTALDILSTVPPDVSDEFDAIVRAGASELTGACTCCAAWGLSLVITAHIDGARRTLLFDAGPEAYAFERNTKRLGVDLAAVESVALSHGHWDHAGGLPAAIELIRAARGGEAARAVPMHVNPGMFGERGFHRQDGSVFPLGHVPTPEELSAAGASVVNSSEARLLLDDTFYLSGEIPRVTSYEKGLPKAVRRGDDGAWTPDPLILDERFLAVHVRGRGLVVFSSCSHAGIVNVLTHAASLFGPAPIHAIMGGLHLSGPANEKWIDETVRDLGAFGLKRIVPGHCTGYRATHALLRAFGDAVVPGAVGQVFRFGVDEG
jgi:7,8-dihydropterin-6-yl-methyl-4-(beta-D-ribofuranosyl)aminobenzene 5'-phosphate synthase